MAQDGQVEIPAAIIFVNQTLCRKAFLDRVFLLVVRICFFQAVRQRILNALKEMQWLKGFDPHKQLFYMNSKFALESQKHGFITDQYNALLHGMQKFFPVGHRKKIKLAQA